MTTHIFVVDSTTFKVHLENLFVGTGAKDFIIDFNNNFYSNLNPMVERLLTSMIADASRIRKNDKIIFYLQQTRDRHTNQPKEGKFFGVFKVKNDELFLDNNDNNQFLKDKLNKSLTFRIEIEPDTIYPLGISEWECLDEIKNVSLPHQMLWSIIYRKLRGNRGNTMITLYESERLINLIKEKNQGKVLSNSKQLSFEQDEQKIIELNKNLILYEGKRKEVINILPRLLERYRTKKSFETHLQAYIVKNIGKSINKTLDQSLLPFNSKIEWIGNEVGCGVGMQSIDILIDCIENNKNILIPIELKFGEIPSYIINQIQRYIDWLIEYYKPNRECNIKPILICKKHNDKQIKRFNEIVKKINDFNEKNKEVCYPLKLIEFEIKENNLNFFEINY